MGEYDDTADVTVELPSGLLAALDEAGERRGCDERSDAVRAAVAAWVEAVDEERDDSGGGGLGGLTDRFGATDVDVDVGVDVDEG